MLIPPQTIAMAEFASSVQVPFMLNMLQFRRFASVPLQSKLNGVYTAP